MRSWLRVLGSGAALLAIALFSLLALAGTERGSAWLVQQADRFMPGELEVAASEGVLLADITLRGIAYRSPTHTAHIQTLRLAWRPAALLGGLLHVRRFDITGVRYTGPPAEDGGPPALPRTSPLPVRLRLDELRLEDIAVQRGAAQFRLSRAELAGTADARMLRVERLALSAPPVDAELEARLSYGDPSSLGAWITWSAAPAQGPTVEGRGRIAGPLDALELQHQVTAPFAMDTAGTVAVIEDGIRIDVSGDWRELHWPTGAENASLRASGRYRLQGDLGRLTLELESQAVSSIEPFETFRLSLNGSVEPSGQYAYEGTVAWQSGLTDGAQLAGTGRVSGDLENMRLSHRVTAPVVLETHGSIALQGEAPILDLAGTWQRLRWPLTGAPRVHSAQGQYRVQGPLDEALQISVSGDLGAADWPVDELRLALEGEARAAPPYPFQTSVKWSGTMADGIELAGAGRLHGDAREFRVEHRLQAPVMLTTGGRIDLARARPGFELEGDWRELRWPLTGTPRYTSADGSYRVDGELDAYRVRLEGNISGEQLPELKARLEGRGDANMLDLEVLSVETPQGSASAQGRVAWSPHPAWDLALSGRDLNPGMWRSDLPGRLDLTARTSGQWRAGHPRFEVELERLSGSLRGYPVRGSGAVAFADERLDVRALDVSSGDNHIHVDGSVAAQMDLAFDVEAPALSQISPRLRGTLEGSGRARGPRANPNVNVRLQGEDLGFRDYRADLVRADVQIDSSAASASVAEVLVRGLRAGDRSVPEIALQGRGTLEDHRLQVRMTLPVGRTEVDASGKLITGTWRAAIERALVDTQPGGVWRLRDAQRLTLSTQRATATRGCWVQEANGGRLCIEGAWTTAEGFDASAEMRAVPLALAGPLLPPKLRIEGLVDGGFDARGARDRIDAELRLTTTSGLLRYATPEGEFVDTPYRDARLEAAYRDGRLRADFAVVLAEDGRAEGSLRVAAPDARGARALHGRVSVAMPDIAVAQVFVPRLDALGGSFEAQADLGGTVQTPTVQGEGRLRGGKARIPELGIELDEAELTARSRGRDRIVFEGRVSSGPGRLDLAGELALDPERGWPLALTLRGEGVEVARLPEAQVFVSPDLQVRMQEQAVEVSGAVRVPEAHIRLKELPAGAVRVSGDEVIVDARGEPVPTERTRVLNLVARIEIVLGDDVDFRGFGLRARLEGALEVNTRPGQRTAQGTVSLQEATYKAYGQDLTIERGRLIFAGPIENPTLDFRAVRQAGGVTVGLDVRGSLQAPRSRIFSEPPMAEAEALSYLLTGRPLGGASQSEGVLLARAAMSLGVERSEMLTQQIAQSVGLDEIRVDTGETMEESAVVLGKYLTPDLYVGYALGLFDQAGTVKLEYRLTENWSLEAKSGEAQSMDLIFTIEREDLLPPAQPQTQTDLTTEDTEESTEGTE